jgi:hypothetical protein
MFANQGCLFLLSNRIEHEQHLKTSKLEAGRKSVSSSGWLTEKQLLLSINKTLGQSLVRDLISVDHCAEIGISNTLHTFALTKEENNFRPQTLPRETHRFECLILVLGSPETKATMVKRKLILKNENAKNSIQHTAKATDADADSFKKQ